MRGKVSGISFYASLKPLPKFGTWWFTGGFPQILTISFNCEEDLMFE
jgi:hypothetical protein